MKKPVEMFMRIISCFILLVLSALFPTYGFADEEQVPVIVLLGDSITKGVRPGVIGEETFGALLEKDFLDRGQRVQVMNLGVGKEDTSSAVKRWRMVMKHSPDVVVIMYGTNDSYIDDGNETSRISISDYENNLLSLVKKFRAAEVQPLLMTPPPFAGNVQGRKPTAQRNKPLERYVNACRRVADNEKVELVDNFKHWADQESHGGDLNDWTTDGCHPNPIGHREIANLLWPVIFNSLTNSKVEAIQ